MKEQEHIMVLMKLITQLHMLVSLQNNMKEQEHIQDNMIVQVNSLLVIT